MTEIVLDARDVPAHLRGLCGYSGRTYAARVVETVTIPADAGLWSGGSRCVYHAVRLADGADGAAADHDAAPWDARGDRRVQLRPGFAIVRHSISCGRDLGLTFFVHPADAAPMLPAPVHLDPTERLVLKYTCERKSSYGGRDRYDMAQDDARWTKDAAPFPTRAQWDDAKARLIARGLLNKAGAATTAGRNAHRA